VEISIDRTIYVGLAALVALAVWFFLKTGYSPPQADEPKRKGPADPRTAELLRARKTVLRQIEQQQQALRRGKSDFADEGLDRLKAIVAEIDAELEEGEARK